MKGFRNASIVHVGLLCACIFLVPAYGVKAQEISFSAAEGYSDGPLLGQPAGAAETWMDGAPATGALTFEVANEAMVVTPDGVNDYWVYLPIPNQSSGMLTATWDWQYVGPEDSNVDIGFMLSDVANFDLDGNPDLHWNEQSCMVRMQQETNVIDVRNGDWEGGGGYEALEEFPYTDGKLVSMRMEINLDEQTYDVYAQKEGEAEVQLADDFGFRRAFQDGLNAIPMWDDGEAATSSVIVDNIVIGAGAAAIGIFDGSMDIDGGQLGAAGSATYDAATAVYVVEGSGHDIWDAADDFHFVYKEVSGDVFIKANVQLDQGTSSSTWAKAGLMIRDELTPESAHGFSMIREENRDFGPQWRDSSGVGGGSDDAAMVLGGTDAGQQSGIVAIRRQGTTITYYCYDAVTGEVLQLYTHDVAEMEDPVYVGLCVTAHEAGTISIGTFSDVELGAAIGIFDAAVDIDDGTIGPGTDATYDAATDTYTVTGSGTDVWGEVDGMQYVYREWSGDFCITADVSLESGIDEWSKAMLMARQDLTPGSVNITTRMRPDDGQYSTQWRTTADGSSGSTSSDLRVTGQNPGSHRLQRSGDTFYTSCVIDGQWTLIDVNECVMQDPILLGIGVTAHSANALCTGTFSNVTITPMAGRSFAEGYKQYK